jgi:hypothetical protein
VIVKYDRKADHVIYKLKDGRRVIGASTVAKVTDDYSALMRWAHSEGRAGRSFDGSRQEAADAGAVGHFMIECHLKGNTPDLSDFSGTAIDIGETIFLKFLDFWQQEGLNLVASELALVSEIYEYGGTLDVVARDRNNRLVLIDEKSSKGIYESHLFQLSGYEHLWNENNAERITRRAIFRNGKKEKGDTEIRWMGDMDKYFACFKAQNDFIKAKKKIYL